MSTETTATQDTPLVAADLLKSGHPLNAAFTAYCVAKSVEVTKRQARKFLAENPRYTQAKTA
jgi:hypothetical protein